MRHTRTALLLLLAATFVLAGYLTLRSFGLVHAQDLADVRPVPEGHQEIAWIGPATSGDTWERLVEAARRVQERWAQQHPEGPQVQVCFDHVFREQTTEVPELALWLEGCENAKLWLRWYKISSETDAPTWVRKLAGRDRPPAAVLGGDSTGRALILANALQKVRGRWHGPAPLFLITTATADRYTPADQPADQPLTNEQLPKLMHVYKDRSFRFSFTNSRMAEVVLEFVWSHPEVWSPTARDFALNTGALTTRDSLATLAVLAGKDHVVPVSLYSLAWMDDAYSKDLADRFGKVFTERFQVPSYDNGWVDYSVGDHYHPNPPESLAVWIFLNTNPRLQEQRQLLVLPNNTQCAGRFLRTLVRNAPLDIRNLVVLSGDSINFNQIYRDCDVAWNIQEMPVPLIFFCHRNPIDDKVGFRRKGHAEVPWATTGTQDLLLYRDILESLVYTAYGQPGQVADADRLNESLRRLLWQKGKLFQAGDGVPFFDEEGNRRNGTGEHIVWLQPYRDGTRVLPRGLLRVWRQQLDTPPERWRELGELEIFYEKLSSN